MFFIRLATIFASSFAAAYKVHNSGQANCDGTPVTAGSIGGFSRFSGSSPVDFNFPDVPSDLSGKSFTRAILSGSGGNILAPVLIFSATNEIEVNWAGIFVHPSGDDNNLWLTCST
ncbi:hypothetical protein PYCC9005_002813 [Savitreella phatthalungensis]